MKGNACRKSDFHFYYPPRFSRGGNFFALEIARNIIEIAVVKDERGVRGGFSSCFRSRHVFDRRKSESQVCHSSNQSENSEM